MIKPEIFSVNPRSNPRPSADALTAEQVKALYNEGSAVRFGPAAGSP